MFKINIVNNNNGREFNSYFSTQEELDLWKTSQLQKGSWGSEEDLTITESDVSQMVLNDSSKEFLKSTDWKVIRHRDQVEAGISTSLTTEEYQTLLADRQTARESIIE